MTLETFCILHFINVIVAKLLKLAIKFGFDAYEKAP